MKSAKFYYNVNETADLVEIGVEQRDPHMMTMMADMTMSGFDFSYGIDTKTA